VLCRHCESKPVRERRSAIAFEPTGRSRVGLREWLCEACGSVLPPCQPDDFLLRRLSQFARFGIGAESAPLLTDPGRAD